MQATLTLDANLFIDVHDVETGELIQHEEVHNLVVTAGRNQIRDFLAGSAPTAPTHFWVGTGTTAVVAGDTDLQTPVAGNRDVITQATTASGSVTIKYFLNSSTANGSTLTEAGIFNAVSGGTMLARATYSGISKTSAITVTYSWLVTLSAS